MIPALNCVRYACSSARRTPGVSLQRSLTLEENIVAITTKEKVIGNNLKRQIKNRTL